MFITIIIVLISIAFITISTRLHRNTKIRDSLYFDDNLAPQLRISVIITSARSVKHIASMLLSESTSYQVIVVSDFSQNQTLLRQITQYFGLFRTSYAPSGELPPDAVRGLLRSHRRLFSKVMVVDSPTSNIYTAFEVGAAVSTYNFNLQIRSPRSLRAKAIENLLIELSIHPEGEVEEIRSAIGERIKLVTRESALPSGLQRNPADHKKRIYITYRLLQ